MSFCPNESGHDCVDVSASSRLAMSSRWPGRELRTARQAERSSSVVALVSRYKERMREMGDELRSISRGRLSPEPTLEEMEDPHVGRGGRRLYVIQVRGRGHLSPLGGLYVGQTKQGRHARFKVHHAGGPTAAKGLAGNCVRLRPELYAHLDLMPDNEKSAEHGEYELARRLSDAGFAVQTNGCHYSPSPPHARKPFTRRDLGRISLPLRRHLVTDLVQDELATVEINHVVHALRWCRDRGYGAVRAGLAGRPSVGRLAHVELAAVEDLVELVLSRYR
jgi:hypothetical protein